MLTFNGIFGETALWEISIFSFKVSQVLSNFLPEHVLHLKPGDCHPKIPEHCRNKAKTVGILYGLWVASHPVPMSPSELMLQENSPPKSNLPPQRVHEGAVGGGGRGSGEGRRKRENRTELIRAEFFNPLHIRITHGAFKQNPHAQLGSTPDSLNQNLREQGPCDGILKRSPGNCKVQQGLRTKMQRVVVLKRQYIFRSPRSLVKTLGFTPRVSNG